MDIEQAAVDGGWLSAYRDLRAHGLHWKKAAFCAWYNAPKDSRKPDNQEELAKLLNYKSPQVFYKWQKQPWFRALGIDKLREAILLRHLGDVDRATIAAALNETGSPGVQARKLFYDQLIVPVQRVEHSGPDGGPMETKELSGDNDTGRVATILSILAEAGAIPAPAQAVDDAEDDEVHPAQPDA